MSNEASQPDHQNTTQSPPSATDHVTRNEAGLMPAGAIRTVIGGLLMGTANLIPGVSGGTMILAIGLYDEFIDAVADITAMRFSLRRILFLGVLGASAVTAIVGLSSLILYLLFAHPAVMFALFIGLTLGGTPTLLRMIGRPRPSAILATALGFGLMVVVALLRSGAELPRNTAMDFVSGVVGSTTMVLPGISGSYMLLVMNQYDRVLGAVDDLREGALAALKIVIPVGIGAVLGIIGLSNLLKVLLHRYEKATLGFLLGMLLGSVLGLWPFGRPPTEKILEKRNDSQLQAHAAAHGMKGAADLQGQALVEHILVGWDLWKKNPGRVVQVHDDESLHKFARREHIDGTETLSGKELASYTASTWQDVSGGGDSDGNVVAVLVAVVVGFVTTTLLGRLKRQGKPTPDHP